MSKRPPHKRIRVVLSLLLVGFAFLWGVWRVWFDPYRGTVRSFSQSKDLNVVLTQTEAEEDFAYVMDRLRERHPACMEDLPLRVREAVRVERDWLSAQESITVLSLWQSTARVLSTLGDAHTSVRAFPDDVSFQTPNANLALAVSYKYFTRPDSSKNLEPLIPDIKVTVKDAFPEVLRRIHTLGE